MTSFDRASEHYLKREFMERLRHDPAIFDFLEAASLDGLWYWDLERMDQEWLSPRFKSFFGFAEHEMPHTPDWWQANIHPDDLQRALANFEAHRADPDHPYDQVVRYRHRQGHTVWVRCRGLIVRDEAGRPLRMLGAHTDVTALKRREQELEVANAALSEAAADLTEARDAAEAAARHKSDFLSNMSHEIRTPLTGIIGSLELLRASKLTAPQKKLLQTALHSADVLMSIIDGVLNLSKMEAGQLAAEIVDFDGRLVFGETLAALQSRARGKGIGYHVQVEDSAARWLRSDPEKISQILFNLVGNAIKFTKEGGVTVSVAVETAAPETAGAGGPGTETPLLTVTVADTGIGIGSGDLSRIFGRFEQVRDPNRPGIQGTGLGLAITRTLCDLLGGSLSVESEVDKGSTFRCEIPVALASPGPAPDHGPEKLGPELQGTILVAEDNLINQQIIAAMLDKIGCRYHIVEDGRKAVDFVAENGCALILMDMQMPVMTGLEAAEEIRRLPGETGRVPIVSLSADVMTDDREKFGTVGIDASIQKPFKFDELIEVIKEYGGYLH